MTMTELYSTEEFERKYTYSGSDLGARWTREKTLFRLWAPTAKSVKVNLYRSGNPGVEDRISQIEMKSAVAGTWTAEVTGDQNGVYYTFTVELPDGTYRAYGQTGEFLMLAKVDGCVMSTIKSFFEV